MTGRAAAVALVALALAASAGAAPAADPGVSSTSVLLGGTVPLTGEAAAFGTVGPGAKAYFDYVNAKGGVNGRRIEYRYYDDAYNPAQTVQLTRRLVEQDKVFAIFNSIGTANNLAVREYLNAQKVPQLYAADGSQSIGRSFARYPWTMGFLQSYRGEGNVYGKTIVTAKPKARIAVLYENTELGLDMLTGLTRAIAGKGPRIVAKQSYEFTGADVSSQVGLLEGLRRRHAHALRDAEVLPQRHPRGAQPRLEAAGLHRVGLDRADDHGHRALQRARADEGRALDRVPQEPQRPGLGEGPGRRASTARSCARTTRAGSRPTSTTGTAWQSRGRWSRRSGRRGRTSRGRAC